MKTAEAGRQRSAERVFHRAQMTDYAGCEMYGSDFGLRIDGKGSTD
jgi:hypothetical protein